MDTIGFAHLEFDPQINNLTSTKKLTDGLSAVVQIGNTLWVANDETISLERLFLKGKDSNGHYVCREHTSFPLKDFLVLPVVPHADEFEEADVEGLDCDDGYLWLVCSHSLKRKKADKTKKPRKNVENLATVSSDGNRYLLARIPLVAVGQPQVPGHEFYTLLKKVQQPDGTRRRAAQLPGNATSSQLTQLIQQDPHLSPFLKIPGKDNGFDIEGLAVAGNRIFIGLRGPVLRGWAIILELNVAVDNDPSLLKLLPIDPVSAINTERYRKHFLELGGLGVRDLCVQGTDLLIMAGPTMDLDGPVTLFRWVNGTRTEKESVVFRDELLEVGSLPFGKGEDHPEGMTLFSADDLTVGAVLIVDDAVATSVAGRKLGENGLKADLFPLAG